MNLFKKIRNSSTKTGQKPVFPWINLTDASQLQNIVESSNSKLQIIFKHSTRCGISRMVKNQFEKDYNIDQAKADLYYLDLLNYRDISNAVTHTFSVNHESPQLLAVKQGKVVVHASHGAINDIDLTKFV